VKVIDDHYICFRSTRHAKEERRPVRRYGETSSEVLDGLSRGFCFAFGSSLNPSFTEFGADLLPAYNLVGTFQEKNQNPKRLLLHSDFDSVFVQFA